MSKIVKQIGELDTKLSKNELVQLGKEHANAISLSEQFDLLKVYVELKRYEIYLKSLTEGVKQKTFEKVKETGRRDFVFGSARVTLSKWRKFNYSGDDVWNELVAKQNQFREMKTKRQNYLKSIKGEFVEILDEDTGETIRVNAPEVELAETLTIRFLKS